MEAPIYDASSMWELVARRAEVTPERPMLIDESGNRITFGRFAGRCEELASALHTLGIGPATVVSWQLPTRIDTIVLSMALARLGAVQNPILHIYREREVSFVLSQMGSEFFFVPRVFKGFDFADMAQRAAKDLDRPPAVVLADAGLPGSDPAGLPAPPAASTADDVRWVYYTSGTTSDPKGVRHTDRTLLTGGRGLAMAVGLEDDDVGSIAFPFAHIAGPDYLVMILAIGFTVALVESFVPAEAVETFTRHGVTMAGGSTAFYQAYLSEQRKQPDRKVIPSLRLLSGGGAAMPPEVFDEVRREIGVTVAHGYGMTEIPMIAMGSPGEDDDEQLANTVGKPVYDAEIRIVGSDGHEVPVDVDGEVRVRGPMVCKGYTDPAQSAEAFDEEGWFRTGDIGHMRRDGHLVLSGRLKDIIIRKGENISAKEIEDILYTHAKVRDVAVIGLPDRERGERVCAVVESPPDSEPLTFDEMTQHLRSAGLITQKLPEQLEVVDALPRNATLNKVLKYKLRERYAVAGSGG
ncbi:MAG: class I adenylate-forming enzyme family protein [Acidimicrobiales bacterium]